MRKTFTTLFAIALLCLAGPAFAADTMTTEGTIIQAGDNVLVIQTDEGEQNFIYDGDTNLPSRLEIDTNAKVTYWENEDGDFVVSNVVLSEEDRVGMNEEQENAAAADRMATERNTEMNYEADDEMNNEMDRRDASTYDNDSNYDNDRYASNELPRTGSNLPLFALLGGLALVGGLALRRS